MTPNNMVQSVWNKQSVANGNYPIYVPNDFADYDEVWAHVKIHGTTGAPASGSIQIKWQISHPQSGGNYHDQYPEWNDLDYTRNPHMFHSGLDWPLKLVRTVPAAFSPTEEFVRGIRLATGRARLKIIVNLSGGTSPAYLISVAIYARRMTPDSQPIAQPKNLSVAATLYDYVRDVWGYTFHNKDATNNALFQLKDTSASGTILINEYVAPNSTITRMFNRPVRAMGGLWLDQTGATAFDATVFTTDNIAT